MRLSPPLSCAALYDPKGMALLDTDPYLMKFFTPPRDQFFRPLTHDSRELCSTVLRALHERVHGANADYAEALTREVVLEVILRALTDPVLRAALSLARRLITG